MVDSVEYEVEYTDEVILVDNLQCVADVNYNTAKIRLSDEVKGSGNEARILLHEIIHALLFERGLKEDSQNESLVDELSAGIINLFRKNPELVNYITKKGQN